MPWQDSCVAMEDLVWFTQARLEGEQARYAMARLLCRHGRSCVVYSGKIRG